ncbi:hypothetical protein Nepgr_002728 [Nepenthes gracilis]|uniref:Uncharacterized protein n=1 Tax=Nepenthes gracilis TaxID=150966 RepID=A0AAD3RY04_NEPGR|nr:hypothetical protein Nepgr_002728 [Nepenthes gracilis]
MTDEVLSADNGVRSEYSSPSRDVVNQEAAAGSQNFHTLQLSGIEGGLLCDEIIASGVGILGDYVPSSCPLILTNRWECGDLSLQA